MHRNTSHSPVPKDEVITLFTGIADSRAMSRLFDELFTEAEIRDLALRWRLMRLLHEGVPQRTIAAQMGVSLCKITRGAKILRKKGSLCKSILDNQSSSLS